MTPYEFGRIEMAMEKELAEIEAANISEEAKWTARICINFVLSQWEEDALGRVKRHLWQKDTS